MVQFSGSGAVSGAGTGAKMGSSFGPWGTAIGGVAGGILGGLSFGNSDKSSSKALASQYAYNKKLMQLQNDMNVHNYKHRYQWQVEDLKSAGIHPWYGIGNSGTGPTVTGGTVGMPDMVGEKKARQEAILQGLQLVQDWTSRQAENKLKQQQLLTEEQNTRFRALEVIEKELSNKYLEPRLKNELQKQKADIIKAIAETNQIKENTETIARTNKWHKKHPNLSEIATAGQELTDTAKAIESGGTLISNLLPWNKKGKKKQKNTPRDNK